MAKKAIPIKYRLLGETLENAIDIIANDTDYVGNTKYYWLSVPVSFENILHYIRFPQNNTLTVEHENGIITKVY